MHCELAEMKTEKASNYVQRLCKHFAHKVPVEYSKTQGRAEFDGGYAEMLADDSTLRLKVVASSDFGLQRCKAIVEDHLVRFAFREKLERLDWYPGTES